MVFERQLPKGILDRLLIRLTRDAEHFVVVSFVGHHCAPDRKERLGRRLLVFGVDHSSAAGRRRLTGRLRHPRPRARLGARVKAWSDLLEHGFESVSLVALTSKTPLPNSMIVTSNVPPPKSMTAIRSSWLS